MNTNTAPEARMLPRDHDRATLVGRIHDPACGGACVVHWRDGAFADVTPSFPTTSHLLEQPDPVAAVTAAPAVRCFALDDVTGRTGAGARARPSLLAPCDLQAVKACGVTFVRSMLERVIEERAAGAPARAASIRAELSDAVGGPLADLVPGSAAAQQAKALLEANGLWSPYLEVGIGPDAEVFTKAQILSAVGTQTPIGVLRASSWNNPEPETVLAVNSRGEAVGATLGNDVNLRDFEGRSALLLAKAKDNNASCAIGPLIRLFDAGFGMDDVRELTLDLEIRGGDGFHLQDRSAMRDISRPPQSLVAQTIGAAHQYPDGFMLFLGTPFAPVVDRHGPGLGFTHAVGDRVTIAAPALGALTNTVAHCEDIAPWRFGVRALFDNLAARGLAPATSGAAAR